MALLDKIKKIVDTYGYEAQKNQCIEECAELIQALNKLSRANGLGQPTKKTKEECLANVVEEIADVQVTLYELMYSLHIGGINEIIERKLDRTLGEIENDEG